MATIDTKQLNVVAAIVRDPDDDVLDVTVSMKGQGISGVAYPTALVVLAEVVGFMRDKIIPEAN